LRQAVLGLVFGLAAWLIAFFGILLIGVGVAEGGNNEVNPAMILGVFIILVSPLPAIFGVGQAAAAIRARGNHMILATSGLLLSGLSAGLIVGLFGMALWEQM
jgi:hypothetical protein